MTDFDDSTSSDSGDDDIRLFRDLDSGNPETLGALYDRYGRIVFSLAAKMLSDRREIEEVTQDVFLAVWNRSYEEKKSSPLTWLATITRNKCIDRLRRAGSRIPHSTDDFEEQGPVVDERRASDPFQMTALGDLTKQVRECLGRLSGSQRVVVESAYFDFLTMEEIANRCSIPSGTVKSRLRLASDRLRKCLKPGGGGQ